MIEYRYVPDPQLALQRAQESRDTAFATKAFLADYVPPVVNLGTWQNPPDIATAAQPE